MATLLDSHLHIMLWKRKGCYASRSGDVHAAELGAWRIEQLPAGGPAPRCLTALTSEGGRGCDSAAATKLARWDFHQGPWKAAPPHPATAVICKKNHGQRQQFTQSFHLRYHYLATYFVETKNVGPLVPKAGWITVKSINYKTFPCRIFYHLNTIIGTIVTI